MSRKILKIFSLSLWIVVLGGIVSGCAMNLSSPQESTDQGTASTQGVDTTADNSTPSGQGTQEGHGEGDFATLIINGILSQEDADRLANSNVVSALFTVAMQSGPAPLMDGDWTQMGGWSSSDLSIIFSDSSRLPPPRMKDYCLYPYLRIAGLYEVKTVREGVIHYEYYMSPWVLQDCPKDINLFRMDLPLALQCQDCGPPKDATLKVQGVLSEEDAARLASSSVTKAVFGVTMEGGPDPSSESDWTLMGIWNPSGLSLTFSDAFGALPPSLSQICLFPYVRLTGAYKVGIETINGIETEVYKSKPIVQACPMDWDVAQVTLPLILCQDCMTKTPPGLTVQGILSEADLNRLANATISDPFFSVRVETGSDPNSERNWSSVGDWSSSSRLITFSSFSDASPPYLSDICLESYVRLTATLKMNVEFDGLSQPEYYQSLPVIQACPRPLDSILLPLSLILQAPQ